MPAAVKDLTPKTKTLIGLMAEHFSLEPEEFKRVIKNTCGLGKCNDDEFLAFLMVAHEHDLNPLTREIYAFQKQGGGIQPIVGVDGWLKKMNSNPMFDGIEYNDHIQGGQLVAITAKIYRKDRTHATEVTEYMKECKRQTQPWQQWPARMLRHKATVQAIRTAFNLSGIMDPDEAERYLESIKSANAVNAMPTDLDAVADAIPANEPPAPQAAIEDRARVVEVEPEPDRPLNETEMNDLEEQAQTLGYKPRELPKLWKKIAGVDSLEQVFRSALDLVIAALMKEAENR